MHTLHLQDVYITAESINVKTDRKPEPAACNCQDKPLSRFTSRHPSPRDQPSHKGLDKSIHILRCPANGQTDRQVDTWEGAITGRKEKYLTCEAEGAFAGVLWGGRWRTRCDARGSIQTSVWFYQTGVAYVLTELSDPSRGTDTLQENSPVFV